MVIISALDGVTGRFRLAGTGGGGGGGEEREIAGIHLD